MNARTGLEMVDFLLGSSVAPEIVEAVRKRVEGKKVMITLDSDHHKDHVLKELFAYSPFVQVGGYMIVQDTNLSSHPVKQATFSGPGPWKQLTSSWRQTNISNPTKEGNACYLRFVRVGSSNESIESILDFNRHRTLLIR